MKVDYEALQVESASTKSNSARHFSFLGWLRDPLVRQLFFVTVLVLVWYFLSTCLGIYNKQLVGKSQGIFGEGGFPAPLLMVAVQFGLQALLARATFAAGIVARARDSPMAWRDWTRMVLPNGVITGLDIGLSNNSLVYITMSFYTMCKSTTPIFLMLFAFLWGLEKPSWELAGVVTVIVSGLLLLVRGEAQFNLTGFSLVMTASACSGLRFVLTQVLLQGDHAGPFGGPLEVVELLTPVMSACTLLLSLAAERPWVSLPASPYFSSLEHSLISCGIMFVGAVIAFCMVWAEYKVIQETSALTFMIIGTLKEVVTVIAAVLFFKDQFGVINAVGLLIVICGVFLFNLYKLKRYKPRAAAAAHARCDASGDDSDDDVGSSSSGGSGEAREERQELVGGGLPRSGRLSPGDGSDGGGGKDGGGTLRSCNVTSLGSSIARPTSSGTLVLRELTPRPGGGGGGAPGTPHETVLLSPGGGSVARSVSGVQRDGGPSSRALTSAVARSVSNLTSHAGGGGMLRLGMGPPGIARSTSPR